MKKITTLFLSLLLLTQSLFPAFADGMIWEYDDAQDEWSLLPETKQRAYINHEDGIQKMLLSINVESLSENDTVWIFPVPALPEDTVIDILDEFPATNGTNIRESAKEQLFEAFEAIRFTQLYYIPLFALAMDVFNIRHYRAGSSYGAGSIMAEDAMMPSGGEVTLKVHESIEKEGLTTELITAKTSEAIEGYFATKGLTIPEASKEIIDEYIGEDFSFVISWKEKEEIVEENTVEIMEKEPPPIKVPKPSLINAPESVPFDSPNSSEAEAAAPPPTKPMHDYVETGLSVYVSFPTEEIFFPLKPTSLYGSAEIPVWIFVKGHVEPDTFKNIQPYTKTEHLIKSYFYQSNEGIQKLLGMNENRIRKYLFTKITIESPSKLFTEDLWIKKGSPLMVKVARVILNDWTLWISGIILLVILSCVASLLAGLIAFRSTDLPKKSKLFFMGLWNLLSFMGFILANIYLKTKPIPQAFEAKLKAENTKVIIRDRRKIGYAILFTIIFLALSAIVEIILFYSL